MKLLPNVPKEKLHAIFDYVDGRLFRKDTGKAAGGVCPTSGYRRASVEKQLYLHSRLVWMYHYGDIPPGLYIDHQNGQKTDDCIENLRLCTSSQNNWNRGASKNNKVGVKGVCWDRAVKRYRVQLTVLGESVYIDWFDDPEEAELMSFVAREFFHGTFVRG